MPFGWLGRRWAGRTGSALNFFTPSSAASSSACRETTPITGAKQQHFQEAWLENVNVWEKDAKKKTKTHRSNVPWRVGLSK
jgi:hypothetical protein